MFLLIEEITFALGSVKAAGRIHREMLHSILRTPLSFFDTTPVGRILNRFSKDQETIDSQLPASIMDFLMSGVTVISVVILLCVAAPMFTVFVIPIGTFLSIFFERQKINVEVSYSLHVHSTVLH
jgi:ABC-type multidrug transport system fused ATPase/permease subunit